MHILTIYGDELYHHGIPGQKWGIRRYQNRDGTWTVAGKERRKKGKAGFYGDDEFVKKGTVYSRVTRNQNEKFKKRLYVSKYVNDYLNDYYVDGLDSTYVVEYKAKKDVVIAGEQAIQKILHDIGQKPLKPYAAEDGSNYTDADFMFEPNEIRKSFVSELKKRGYAGLKDPVDNSQMSSGIGASYSATIFTESVLKKVKAIPVRDIW